MLAFATVALHDTHKRRIEAFRVHSLSSFRACMPVAVREDYPHHRGEGEGLNDLKNSMLHCCNM